MAAHLQQCVGSFDKIKGIKIADEHVQSETGRQTGDTCSLSSRRTSSQPSPQRSIAVQQLLWELHNLIFLGYSPNFVF